ncbi:helix-turn-helix domain-containing protein [Mycolicibacter arupensis]|nr:helix-turn-helix domain-containing protein [Mycolicibacter arupensis]MCV7274890.1 helix-turn-helix domain-containing protein [Mycolicibacter arupensis]
MQTRESVRQLVPIENAQKELGGIGRTTLYRLVKEGHLTRANIGRRSFITGESLAAYVSSITEDQ